MRHLRPVQSLLGEAVSGRSEECAMHASLVSGENAHLGDGNGGGADIGS